MKRTIGACLLVLLVGGATLVGCGGGAESSDGTSATAAATSDTPVGETTGGDPAQQAASVCVALIAELGETVGAALTATFDLVDSVEVTTPEALSPVYASIADSFGAATDLVSLLRTEFAAIEATSDLDEALVATDTALEDAGELLGAVEDAAAAEDRAELESAIDAIDSLDTTALAGAFTQMADEGAEACRPVD